VKVERVRLNAIALTLTPVELSTLIAAARMALDAARVDPLAPAELVETLERVLADYDRAMRPG
jgi:hypothetical protein